MKRKRKKKKKKRREKWAANGNANDQLARQVRLVKKRAREKASSPCIFSAITRPRYLE